MDIDSFYQDGDMTFGMDGRISFADESQYLRASGQSRKEQVEGWFPMSNDCEPLTNTIASLKKQIADNEAKLGGKVKRGDRRVTQDYTNLMKGRLNALETKSRELKCSEKQEKTELEGFMTQLKTTLPSTESGGTTDGDTKTSPLTYVLIGVGGLVAIGLTIFVIKKVKK